MWPRYPNRKAAMRIRMKQSVTGTFHGVDGGVERGQVVDVDDVSAARYIKSGLAGKVEETEEQAVVDTETESAVLKPRRGRQKKQPEWHDEKAPGWKEVESD